MANPGILRYECAQCSPEYRTLYYERQGPVPNGINWYRLFTDSFAASANGHPNLLSVDFKLYSTLAYLREGARAWRACSHASGRAFPSDCGESHLLSSDAETVKD